MVGHQGESQHADGSPECADGNIVHSCDEIIPVLKNDISFQSFDVNMVKSGVRSSFHVLVNLLLQSSEAIAAYRKSMRLFSKIALQDVCMRYSN